MTVNLVASAGGPLHSPEHTLDDLVARTAGLQPGRRLFHALNGLIFGWLVGWSEWPPTVIVTTLAVLLVVLLVADALRLSFPGLNILFFRAFLPLASPREHNSVASSTWYVAGVLATSLVFPPVVAGPAVLVLALADPAASVVGRIWGRRRIGAGTYLGSAALFFVASVLLSFFFPVPTALGAAAVAATVEAFPWGLDDNLTIPLAVAVSLHLLP